MNFSWIVLLWPSCFVQDSTPNVEQMVQSKGHPVLLRQRYVSIQYELISNGINLAFFFHRELLIVVKLGSVLCWGFMVWFFGLVMLNVPPLYRILLLHRQYNNFAPHLSFVHLFIRRSGPLLCWFLELQFQIGYRRMRYKCSRVL